MYDLIGDIHGHADELRQLLEMLGYEQVGGSYRHRNRKAIFLGDFIDRGPQIRQVLEIVRPMTETGHALAVMGNHELNALAYHTDDVEAPGEHLRRHSDKNIRQHAQTLEQLQPDELRSYLKWFRTLPLWLDLDGLRVIHACWDERAIATVTAGLAAYGGVSAAFLQSACRHGNPLYDAVEIILKGKEGDLPQGVVFQDKDGHSRSAIRTRWYLPPAGKTYRTYAFQSDEVACDLQLDETVIAAAAPYPPAAKPVFFGHYWLSAEKPSVLADNVACLDFSVAKGGFLCAYRWDGEQTLSNENFVWAGKNSIPIREPDQIRQNCARKLRVVEISDHFQAILGCLLDEDWTTPRLVEMVITPDSHLLGRCDGEASFKVFLGSSNDLMRNIHGVAPVAELDGDEVGYLLGRVAKIKRKN